MVSRSVRQKIAVFMHDSRMWQRNFMTGSRWNSDARGNAIVRLLMAQANGELI